MTDTRCRTFWGSHGCRFDRGHFRLCECACAVEPDEEGVLNVGKPPYYGPDTDFYGPDAPATAERNGGRVMSP